METATHNYRPTSLWLTRQILAGERPMIPGGIVRDWLVWLPVDRENLNEVMDFDHVIEVRENGDVVDRHDLYAPDLWDAEIQSDTWKPFGNYTSQQGGGWLMHNCESIGSTMADDILSTPGVYVAVVAYWSEDEDDVAEGYDPEHDGPIVEGWAVAYLDTPVAA